MSVVYVFSCLFVTLMMFDIEKGKGFIVCVWLYGTLCSM